MYRTIDRGVISHPTKSPLTISAATLVLQNTIASVCASFKSGLTFRYPTFCIDGALLDMASSNVCVTELITWKIDVDLNVTCVHVVLQEVFREYANDRHGLNCETKEYIPEVHQNSAVGGEK